jgi:hypothetical protein
MNHDEMTDLLHDYVRERLSREERLSVDRALEQDPALRSELEAVKAYYRDLKSIPEVKAPDDFLLRVRNRIERPGLPGRLRKLIFYPLHMKLPMEIAGVVAVSLLIIVIFNPFTLKLSRLDSSSMPVSDAMHDKKTPPTDAVNEVSTAETEGPGEKQGASAPGEMKSVTPSSSIQMTRKQDAVPTAGPFAEAMPSGELNKRAAAPDKISGGAPERKLNEQERDEVAMDKTDGSSAVGAAAPSSGNPAMKTGAFEKSPARQFADNGGEAGTPAYAQAKRAEPEEPASAPVLSAPSEQEAASSMSKPQPEIIAAKKSKASSAAVEQISYIWTPNISSEIEPARKKSEERSDDLEESKTVSPLSDRMEKSAGIAGKDEHQVLDNITDIKKLKSDNLAYLKLCVKRAGGSLKSADRQGSKYRIKIPVKNFVQLENGLKSRGVFSSANPLNTDGSFSGEVIEFVISVQE